MSIRGFNLFNNLNNPNLRQGIGQNPFPMRGLERFMQKRGMIFPEQTLLRPTSKEEVGNLSNTLDVQAPPEKDGGIKGFLRRFSRKPKK